VNILILFVFFQVCAYVLHMRYVCIKSAQLAFGCVCLVSIALFFSSCSPFFICMCVLCVYVMCGCFVDLNVLWENVVCGGMGGVSESSAATEFVCSVCGVCFLRACVCSCVWCVFCVCVFMLLCLVCHCVVCVYLSACVSCVC